MELRIKKIELLTADDLLKMMKKVSEEQ